MKTSQDYELVPFEKLKGTKAWKNTSLLVRLSSNGICYTCGKEVGFDKLVAGHAKEKRGHASIYFDLDGLRGQCGYCNRRLHGNYRIYTLKLIDEIGRERVDAYERKSQKTKHWTKGELNKIAQEREIQIKMAQLRKGQKLNIEINGAEQEVKITKIYKKDEVVFIEYEDKWKAKHNIWATKFVNSLKSEKVEELSSYNY